MTKTKSTKRALLMSALALLMCVSMLIGSTFAWFTDSVTSSGNKIVAGTLDIQLLMDADVDGAYDDISDSTSPIFGEGSIAQNNNAATLWEPGKTQVAYLAIKNNGNLALKYTVGLNVQNVSKDLYEVMEYAIVPDADANNKVTSWTSGDSVEVGTQSVSGDVSLAVGATHYFALVIHMDEEAGNEYQGGEVNFDLTVLATQDTVESDSFDNQYDADAEFDTIVYSADELKAALAAGGNVVLAKDIDAGETTFTLPAGKTAVIDLNGHTISGVDKTEKNYGLINVGIGATLTINDSKDSGAITISSTVNNGWNRYSSVISNQRGTVIINGGTIENKGGTSMAYAIDNLTNGKGTAAKTVINSGTITSSYVGIRQFCNGIEAENVVEINGGTITGPRRSVWMQDPNSNANTGTLTINGGTFNGVVLADNERFVVTIADSFSVVKDDNGNLTLTAK